MSTIQDAAARLAEELPSLLNSILHALRRDEERNLKRRLARELVAFAESCAVRAPEQPGGVRSTVEVSENAPELYRCAGPSCPGYPWRASERDHPYTCVEPAAVPASVRREDGSGHDPGVLARFDAAMNDASGCASDEPWWSHDKAAEDARQILVNHFKRPVVAHEARTDGVVLPAITIEDPNTGKRIELPAGQTITLTSTRVVDSAGVERGAWACSAVPASPDGVSVARVLSLPDERDLLCLIDDAGMCAYGVETAARLRQWVVQHAGAGPAADSRLTPEELDAAIAVLAEGCAAQVPSAAERSVLAKLRLVRGAS